MKYSLTITDATPAELAKILATIGATATVITPAAVTADDDESNDADAAPGTVDKTGIPWDERIHSSPAKFTNKGVWRRKKNVDDATVAAVEAQLRATAPVQQPAAPLMQPGYNPGPSFDPTTQPVYQQPAAPVYPAVQQIMQPAPVQQPAPVGPAAGTVDFNGFMTHLQTLLPIGRTDAAHLASVAQRVGAAFNQPVNAITDIAANQQMIDYAVQVMIADGRW